MAHTSQSGDSLAHSNLAAAAQMDALGIFHPVNEDRWPKYLCMLATLSKKCQLEQAQVMHDNHDFRP